MNVIDFVAGIGTGICLMGAGFAGTAFYLYKHPQLVAKHMVRAMNPVQKRKAA